MILIFFMTYIIFWKMIWSWKWSRSYKKWSYLYMHKSRPTILPNQQPKQRNLSKCRMGHPVGRARHMPEGRKGKEGGRARWIKKSGISIMRKSERVQYISGEIWVAAPQFLRGKLLVGCKKVQGERDRKTVCPFYWVARQACDSQCNSQLINSWRSDQLHPPPTHPCR